MGNEVGASIHHAGQGSAIVTAVQQQRRRGDPCMSDGIGLAEAMLGLDGFRVLEVSETPDEVIITVETTATMVGCAGCAGCGVRAEAQDRASIMGLSPHLDHATRIADRFMWSGSGTGASIECGVAYWRERQAGNPTRRQARGRRRGRRTGPHSARRAFSRDPLVDSRRRRDRRDRQRCGWTRRSPPHTGSVGPARRDHRRSRACRGTVPR